MSHSKSIPCYVPNGGEHYIVNIPLGQFTRLYLKRLVNELLRNYQTFGTMVVAKATPKTIQLLSGLSKILDVNLKPKENRQQFRVLTTATEKNLKPTAAKSADDQAFNIVTFAVSCGLVAIMFILAGHLDYLESLKY